MTMNNSGKNSGKKIKNNNRKRNGRCVVYGDASPVKIAYYVQRLLEKKMGAKEIMLIISSQFGNDDVREFAKMYRYCFYMEDIRHIANLIYRISKKDIDGAMDRVVYDILVKKEIFSSEYIQEHFLNQ